MFSFASAKLRGYICFSKSGLFSSLRLYLYVKTSKYRDDSFAVVAAAILLNFGF